MTDSERELLLGFVKLIEFERDEMKNKDIDYRKLYREYIVCKTSKMQGKK